MSGGTQLTYDEFNAFCRGLPATSYVMQWRGSHVWKVGGKVFAIGGWVDEEAGVTFKVNDIAHGDAGAEATYQDVTRYSAVVRTFCTRMDGIL